jgi:fibronectin type 3 domain-containing protein
LATILLGLLPAALCADDSTTQRFQLTVSHDVVLTWTASATATVVGYDVYRGTTSGGEGATPLNASPVKGTTYTDSPVTAGATYYYIVTAVGANGVQSAKSDEAKATVPSP